MKIRRPHGTQFMHWFHDLPDVYLCPISHVHTANIALAVLGSNFLSVFFPLDWAFWEQKWEFLPLCILRLYWTEAQWMLDGLSSCSNWSEPAWVLLSPALPWCCPHLDDSDQILCDWLLPFRSPGLYWYPHLLLLHEYWFHIVILNFLQSLHCFWSFLMLIYSCVCCSFSTTIENSSDCLHYYTAAPRIVPSTEEALNRFCRIDKPGTHSS